jgi:dTDP-4-dehydrorhamnose 3,5-epimerase-like enzyme
MGDFFRPDAARGIHWNDPTLQIIWPRAVTSISGRDSSYPHLDPTTFDAGTWDG